MFTDKLGVKIERKMQVSNNIKIIVNFRNYTLKQAFKILQNPIRLFKIKKRNKLISLLFRTDMLYYTGNI